jgi:uncharacterized protein (DUF849 family)
MTYRDPDDCGKPPGVIVNFTPTGMIPTRDMTPRVPLSVAEIVEDVHRACEIGVTMVHLHARDPQTGESAWRAEIYRDLIEGIRRFAPALVIGVSLSGRAQGDVEKRLDPLRLDGALKPDLGSLTLSSVNFNRQASLNAPETIRRLAGEMRDRAILPELEAFDTGMINYAAYLERKGLLAPPHYFNLILGNVSCAQADLLHVGVMVRDLPPRSLWSLGGIGDSQLPMNAVAIAMGGGVRVGLEDNIWLDRARTTLAGNADLLERIRSIAASCDRPIMTSGELRSLLLLEPGGGRYGRRRDVEA